MVIRRAAAFPLGVLFLVVLLLNVYLLLNVAGGAQIIQQVEAAQGRSLSCYELYEARAIDAYFYPARRTAGEAIYLLSITCTWPLWLGLSIGAALWYTSLMKRKTRWRWFPVWVMGILVLLLILYLPIVAKITCAID
jgi:hypothetical protein